MHRIEVYEKYAVEDADGHSEEWWLDNVGVPPPEPQYAYRRTMPNIDFIERPIEIPGNKKECILRFVDGQEMTILENYDSFCIKLHDEEEQMMIEDESIRLEIERNFELSDNGNI